jgi:BirA family transcriptional regulator, biotin operon repressor / biotin---[acetyl-CoA-carboxylase] ligase
MIDRCEVELVRHLLRTGHPVSRKALAERIRIPDLEGLVESLEQAGFAFDRSVESIRLLSEPDSLVPQAIMARLETKTIGRDVLVYRETSSTNGLARRAGSAGAAEGIVFFAEHQTAGRGTHGRKWVSPPNQGLWLSVLLRSQLPLGQRHLLVQMGALAAAAAVERWSEQPVYIKPPNDLVLGGGKLGGFLLETSNSWDFQVLGIGINVRSAPQIEGYPTAALDQFSKHPIPMAILASELLSHFEDWYLRTPLEFVAPAFTARIPTG